MKKFLLLFFILFTFGFANAQLALKDDCSNCPSKKVTYSKVDIKIYPNPATDYIEFQNKNGQVHRLVIYNLVGRPMRKLVANTGKNWYNISELSKGMYLIQLLNKSGGVITTKRINKR